MKKYSLIILLSSFSLLSQNSDETCELLYKINTLLRNEHFKLKPIDDSLSVYVFDAFVESLDSERNIFLKSEYDTLSKYRLKLDNYILKFSGKSCIG